MEVEPDESRLLLLTARLRTLPDSEYPYAFWHSAAKWHDYQQTTEVALLSKSGKFIAAYRECAQNRGLVAKDHDWSRFWTTDDAGNIQPRSALFDYLLSPGNPERAGLERAYKDLATEARTYQCGRCHTPANPSNMNPLIIFNLPSQALSARHQIVYQIDKNQMPPGPGISDQASRDRLLRLARNFARLGDAALSYEYQQGLTEPEKLVSEHERTDFSKDGRKQ